MFPDGASMPICRCIYADARLDVWWLWSWCTSVLSHAMKNLERSLPEVSTLFAGGVRFAQYAKRAEEHIAKRSFSDWH